MDGNLGKLDSCFMQDKLIIAQVSSCLRMCYLELILKSISGFYAGIASSEQVFPRKKENNR